MPLAGGGGALAVPVPFGGPWHAQPIGYHPPGPLGVLQTAEALGVKEGYLVGKRSPWYKQEQRDPAPFLCACMGRGSDEKQPCRYVRSLLRRRRACMGRGSDQKQPFRFIWNRSQTIGTNLYLMLDPRNGLARILRQHPDRTDVSALLGQATGYELRGEGRVYGGGLNKIKPSELAPISAAAFLERWPELTSTMQRQAGLFDEASSASGVYQPVAADGPLGGPPPNRSVRLT